LPTIVMLDGALAVDWATVDRSSAKAFPSTAGVTLAGSLADLVAMDRGLLRGADGLAVGAERAWGVPETVDRRRERSSPAARNASHPERSNTNPTPAVCLNRHFLIIVLSQQPRA
jgi:hypothetical protein